MSKNVLKIIKKKSTSPEAPKSNEAKVAVVKVSPLRGMMILNKNMTNDTKGKIQIKKVRKSPSPPSSEPLQASNLGSIA